MSEHCIIRFGGEEIMLHGAKLLWLPSLRLLAAADIHFEKGSFFQRFATLLPPYDSHATLAELERWVGHFRPATFIALGDSFHDAQAGIRLPDDIRERLSVLIGSVGEWIWITGNHDPKIDSQIPGLRREAAVYNGIHFRHQAARDDRPEVSGHYHPKASTHLRGMRIASACFVGNTGKLILPSFGSFTGGFDIGNEEFLDVMPREGRRVYLAYRGGVYPL